MEEKPKLWSPKEGDKGMTALHYAAYRQDLAAVKECIKGGFDVNQKDATGYTPLAWCIDMAATGSIGAAESIVDYLVAHGARLEFRDDRYADIIEFARASDESVAQHIERLLTR